MYDILLFFVSLVALPKLLYQAIVYRKYRSSFKQRLGIGFPSIKKGSRQLIWIHAVSLGEAKAVASLARALKKSADAPILIFSTVTETGLAEAKKSVPEADHHVYLPFDFKWIIAPLIARIKPDQVIICETDFWYNFLCACKKAGATLSLVNGKISERSVRRFLKLSYFSLRLFSLFDRFCVQSEHYRQRFIQLGIPSDKIIVTGNLKFDTPFPHLLSSELANWRDKLGIDPSDPVIVIGSTHDPEEKMILKACRQLWQTFPQLKVLLVPRHPERFKQVAQLLQQTGVKFSCYSQGNAAKTSIVLVDAVGVLRQCYQLATLAIVAGSFTPKVGGHNIAEPCGYGVPVLFGPHLYAQPQLLELVKAYGAGVQVDIEYLANKVESLLLNTKKRESLGAAGLRLTHDLQGATERTLAEIIKV